MAKDVIVVVQRDALPKDKESLDILLVSTTGAYPVDPVTAGALFFCELALWVRLITLEVNLPSVGYHKPNTVILNFNILPRARNEGNMSVILILESVAETAKVVCLYAAVRFYAQFDVSLVLIACSLVDLVECVCNETLRAASIYSGITNGA